MPYVYRSTRTCKMKKRAPLPKNCYIGILTAKKLKDIHENQSYHKVRGNSANLQKKVDP